MAMSGINDNAMKVLEKRYLAKNEHGEVTEDVSGLFSRVARAVAQADANYHRLCAKKALSIAEASPSPIPA